MAIALLSSAFSQIHLTRISSPKYSIVNGAFITVMLLGEAPTQAQYLGGSVILLGIFLSQVGISRQSSTQENQTIENKIGFKGV